MISINSHGEIHLSIYAKFSYISDAAVSFTNLLLLRYQHKCINSSFLNAHLTLRNLILD